MLVCLLIFICGVNKVTNTEYPESDNRTFSGCFGDQMSSSCDVSKVILVNDIVGGSKPMSSDCPVVPTALNRPDCCVYESQDCLFPTVYSSGTDDTFHTSCSGRPMCDVNLGLQLLTLNTDEAVCNITEFKSFSQYTQMSYYCVEESRIGNMCGSFSEEISNTPVYIQSDDYPNSVPSGNTDCSCSVETDSKTDTITIYTIHRTLYAVADSCTQSLILEDGTTNTTFTCDDNSNFIPSTQQSNTNYIRLLWTNTATTDGGQFWLGFYAGASNLTVNCPAIPRQSETTTTTSPTSAMSPTSNSPVTTTPFTATPISTVSTSGPSSTAEITTTSVASSLSTQGTSSAFAESETTESTKDPYLIAFIVTVSVIGVILCVILIVICILCIRSRKTVKNEVIKNLPEHRVDIGSQSANMSKTTTTTQPQSGKQSEQKPKHNDPIQEEKPSSSLMHPIQTPNTQRYIAKMERNSVGVSNEAITTKLNKPKRTTKSLRKRYFKAKRVFPKPPVTGKETKSKKNRKSRLNKSNTSKDNTTTKSIDTEMYSINDVQLEVTSNKNYSDNDSGAEVAINDNGPIPARKQESNDDVSIAIREVVGEILHSPTLNRKGGIADQTQVRKPTKRRRRRNKSLKSAQKYESLLKIVTGSAFRYSNVFRKPVTVRRLSQKSTHGLMTRDAVKGLTLSNSTSGELIAPRNSPVLYDEHDVIIGSVEVNKPTY